MHEGCILSRAATNAIIVAIEKKSHDEAKQIILNFKKMLEGKITGNTLPPQLQLFEKFSKFPSR